MQAIKNTGIDYRQSIILIAAHNEQGRIGKVVSECLSYGQVIVVDDASSDSTALEAIFHNAIVLIRPVSEGKGAALSSGISFSKLLDPIYVICLDGDGQHDPKYIPLLMKKAQEGFAIVLGNRLHNKRKMPFPRIISNTLSSLAISLFTQQLVRDSQSGYRLLARKALDISPSSKGFMFESEQLFIADRVGLQIGYCDISTIYRNDAQMRFNIPRDIWQFIKAFARELRAKRGGKYSIFC